MDNNLIMLRQISDERGHLVVLEAGRDIPFSIKRSYYVFGMQGDQPRGFHAHKELQQVIVCVRGACNVLHDDGRDKTTIRLDAPDKGVYIGPMVWHEMHDFTPDCVFVSYASDLYDEADYIRDYGEFMKVVNNG